MGICYIPTHGHWNYELKNNYEIFEYRTSVRRQTKTNSLQE